VIIFKVQRCISRQESKEYRRTMKINMCFSVVFLLIRLNVRGRTFLAEVWRIFKFCKDYVLFGFEMHCRSILFSF
jgi:hypothetical protein